jgi:hypothetical protein
MRTVVKAIRSICTAVIVALPLLMPSAVNAAAFIGDPGVRVTPGSDVEFGWRTDVAWYGEVRVFEDVNGGLGELVAAKRQSDFQGDPVASTEHRVSIDIGGGVNQLRPDSVYVARVTSTDPADLQTQIEHPRLIRFLTGTQRVTGVDLVAVANAFEVSWDANIAGYGRVTISPPAEDGRSSFEDTISRTGHRFLINDLRPGTTYTYRAGNVSPFDGLALASQGGTFTTDAVHCMCIKSPSVRVVPNESVEFEWKADLQWLGRVEILASPDVDAVPVAWLYSQDLSGNPIMSIHHLITREVGGNLAPDATYWFRIRMRDPNGNLTDLVTPTPWPSFFTGTQSARDVRVTPGVTTAEIAWDSNVIGLGRLDFGPTASYGQVLDDPAIATSHRLALSGLDPATTYYYRVSNRHAMDGDAVASELGSFTTLSDFTAEFLAPLDQSADPANPILNTGKNGKVISLRTRIRQSNTTISDLNAPGPVTIAVSRLACGTNAGTDPVETYADVGQSSAGTNRLRYDGATTTWMYGLDTKALGLVTGSCYRIDLAVNGAPIRNAFVAFKPTR